MTGAPGIKYTIEDENKAWTKITKKIEKNFVVVCNEKKTKKSFGILDYSVSSNGKRQLLIFDPYKNIHFGK